MEDLHVKMQRSDEIRCMSYALVLVHSMLLLAFKKAIQHRKKLLVAMDMNRSTDIS